MIKKHTYDGLTWVDLESPSLEEVREVMEEYSINPLVAEELVTPTLRPKVDLHKDFIYLILHFPAFKDRHPNERNQEIDFIVGKKVLITTRYCPIDPLHSFARVFEVNSILQRNHIGDHAGYLFFFMMRSLYHALSDELLYITTTLSDVEDKIFAGKERDMVVELSRINRELLAFKEAIGMHKDVLTSFEVAGKKFFGEEFSYHLRSIIGEYYKVQSAVDSSKEYLNELRDTNDSLLNTKQNETMKRLTVVTFIFLPLQFIISMFGMSTSYIPFMNDPFGFWWILSTVAVLGLTIYVFFRRKELL